MQLRIDLKCRWPSVELSCKFCKLPQGFSGLIYNSGWGTFARRLMAQFAINEVMSNEYSLMWMWIWDRKAPHWGLRPVLLTYEHWVGSHNFYMSKTGGKTGDIFYRPFPRRLERRALCRCHNKGRTFSAVFSKDPQNRLFKQSLT